MPGRVDSACLPAPAAHSKGYRQDGQELLFDHTAGPYQMHSQADDPACERLKSGLKEKMLARMALTGDRFEQTSCYEDHWVKDRLILKTAACGQICAIIWRMALCKP